MTPKSTPITVFTGFLGAGKTTIILSLLSHLPKDYKVVLLKNEFGDIKVDSKLAEQSTVTAVSEILNGCLCCVLVGQMETALLELKGMRPLDIPPGLLNISGVIDKYDPDRIIVECSGSAFPATLALQIRRLEGETNGKLKLDGIITVIDAENFIGYEDTSPTAKMQASYTDLILINKWENVSGQALDTVLDHLNTLNDSTPKVRCRGQNGVDPGIIFEIVAMPQSETDHGADLHHDEVETVRIQRDVGDPSSLTDLTKATLERALNSLSKEFVWRVKGFVNVIGDSGEVSAYIVNWAFGRYNLTSMSTGTSEGVIVDLGIMGERGEVTRAVRPFVRQIGATIVNAL